MVKEVKEQVRFFCKQPVYVTMLILSAAMGYGYVLTHSTCGVDDIAIDVYFEKGLGVAIGRWPYYLINKIIPIAEYTPFIGDFFTILLLMASAITWCVLIRMIVKNELPIICYIVFTVFFMDYSMNADVFVFYLQNGVGLVYLFSGLSLIGMYYLYKNSIEVKQQIFVKIAIIVMLTWAISFYESAANVFLTGGLLVVLLETYESKKKSCFRGKKLLAAGAFIVRYLLYAMVIRRLVRAIIMRVFSINAYLFYRNASSVDWIFDGGIGEFWSNLQVLLAQIYRDYFAVGVVYYPVFLFVICTVVYVVCVIYYSFRNKDLLLGLIGIVAYITMFALCIIQGQTMAYRACQIFTVFVAFVFMIITKVIVEQNSWIRVAGMACIVVCAINSVYDMTKWFALDYRKTEYEMNIIDRIAGDLMAGGYDIQNKPIVVVGDFELPEAIYSEYCIDKDDFGWNIVKSAVQSTGIRVEDSYCYAQNSVSVIDWSINSFSTTYGYNVQMARLFEYRGYTFKWYDLDAIEQALERFYPMDEEAFAYEKVEVYTEMYDEEESFPNKGYIEEMDTYIVVKL